MSKIQKMIQSLAPYKYSIFVAGDFGVVALQEDLRKFKLQKWQAKEIKQEEYENSNGVFLRFSLEGATYSGIVQTEDEAETRSILRTIPPELHKEGAEILTILKTPLDRISLFPFFSILEKNELKEPKRKLARQYWTSFNDDVEALRNWYKDFIRFRREIVATEIPQLEPAVPAWMGCFKVYVLYNKKDRTIATKYYRSPDRDDAVFVEETSESVGLKAETAFSKSFALPPMQDALSESVQFNQESEKVYFDWDHPYISAAEDLKKQAVEFNRAQRGISYDAYKISPSLLYAWTARELSKLRELITRFPLLKEELQRWLQPLQVLVLYFIDDPIVGRVTDGVIAGWYVHGPEDKIIVEKMKTKDDVVKWNNNLVRQYFPASGSPIFGFTSLLVYYLRDKLGADY